MAICFPKKDRTASISLKPGQDFLGRCIAGATLTAVEVAVEIKNRAHVIWFGVPDCQG